MKLVVGNSIYESSRKIIKNCINLATETNHNKYSIVAIEYAGYVEMRNDVFETEELLNEQINYYRQKGIKVYYTRRRI